MTIRKTLKAAQDAFWEVVKSNHPGIAVPTDPIQYFDQACSQAILSILPVEQLPRYLEAFPSFGSLGFDLLELPITFADFSWRNDACPRFEAPGNISIFPRLILWVEFEDEAERESGSENRFILLFGRSDDEILSGEAQTLIATNSVKELSAAIVEAVLKHPLLSLHESVDAEGDECLAVTVNAASIHNPFISECGRFPVPAEYHGLSNQDCVSFLRAVTTRQLRKIIGETRGDCTGFDALPTLEDQQQYAIATLLEASKRENQ